MIYLGADYAGYALKEAIRRFLTKKRLGFKDVGTFSNKKKDDFPDYAKPVAQKVARSTKDLGILVCGTGIGMCVAANRFRGVRAALVHAVKQAKWAKTHDNVNILCLASWAVSKSLALKIIDAWLKTRFEPLPRRVRRFKKIDQW